MGYKPTRTIKEAIAIAERMAEGYNYIYGYKEHMNPVSKNWIDVLAKQNPSYFTQSYIDKSCKFIGKRAIDCSGLICECLGISITGSYFICDFPNSYSDSYTTIKMEERNRGDILWKPGHVGLCKDKNNVVEARSINAGVGAFQFSSQNWQKCIRPKYVEECYKKIGWILEPDGRMWYAKSKKKGDYYKNGFYEIDGKKYLFDEDGYVVDLLLLITNCDGSVNEIVKRLY